jgi:hypothetical protein
MCILDGAVVCRECHDRERPVCPYCNAALERKPTSKSTCPQCKGRILVRTAQQVFSSIYVTEAQAEEIQRYTRSTPASYGVPLHAFALKKRELAALIGRDPTAQEVIDAVNDAIPATDAQLDFARNVAIPLPTSPKKNDVSYLLSVYTEVEADIEHLWDEVMPAGSKLPQVEVGAFAAAIAGDEVLAELGRKRKRGGFFDALHSQAGKKRIAAMARQRWADLDAKQLASLNSLMPERRERRSIEFRISAG